MDLVSLLITVIGIMALLGLYVMSRVFDQTPAKQSSKSINIPTYTDADNNKLSSVKADIPAHNLTPDYAPTISYTRDSNYAEDSTSTGTNNLSKETSENNIKSNSDDADSDSSPTTQTEKTRANQSSNKPSQYVLFIASPSEQQLDGNSIMVAMDHLGFQLGDKDIYHYRTAVDGNTSTEKTNLFSVANGVSPWTLKETDLAGKSTPGLSLIMPLPTPVDIKEAITGFVGMGEKLAIAINGELQNTQQQIFLPTDKELMLKSAGCL